MKALEMTEHETRKRRMSVARKVKLEDVVS
jgi:hypothetical protein